MEASVREQAALKNLMLVHRRDNMPNIVTVTYGKMLFEVGFMSQEVDLCDQQLMWAGLLFNVKEMK